MTHILLVFTGGTIGSTTVNGAINTSNQQSSKLIQLFEQTDPDYNSITFSSIQPLQILSENLFPTAWETLITAIEAENSSQFDGIIVTHGTDTLAFSAAALGLYFNNINIPLLLVSSDHPLEHPQANGLQNFITAIEFIKKIKQPGVFVPYQNQQPATLIHQGVRLSSCLQLSNDFISVQSKAYLQFENNTFSQLNGFNMSNTISVKLKPKFSSRILMIKPYPGLDYSCFSLDKIDAVIHDLYHSGTACSSQEWGENHSLLDFIQRCKTQNIKVYMAPSIKRPDVYDSTRKLVEFGAEMIWNMSLEAAYVKLLLAYGNFEKTEDISRFLQQNIALEQLS